MPRRYYAPRGETYKKYVPKEPTYDTRTQPYRRDEGVVYKSAPMMGVGAKVESQKYTGTLVKGIGTMHKSNAVPIIDEEQMKDLATMRRN